MSFSSHISTHTRQKFTVGTMERHVAVPGGEPDIVATIVRETVVVCCANFNAGRRNVDNNRLTGALPSALWQLTALTVL